MISLIFFGLVAVIVALLRNQISLIYTNLPVVSEYVSYASIFMAISMIFDGLQQALYGIIRGLGIEKQSHFAYFLSVYIFAIPLCQYLSLHTPFTLAGLWLGLPVGFIILIAILVFIICRTNWQKTTLDISLLNSCETTLD